MFIDRVEISVKAGNGGAGCVSFRREKYVPRGGPDGGNGGRGGDVIIRVNAQMRTLLDLRYRKRYEAENGRRGKGKRMKGRSGSSVVLDVPPGTVVEDIDSGDVLADLTSGGREIVVARGGKGGMGNHAFRSSTDQAPRKCTPGGPGQDRRLLITLKLIADVGIVGMPNAGKSTLLRSVSDAHPVVAPYPFSTLTPVLGIIRLDEDASFCMVDIPGLIEGAHRGKGLGTGFLQHIERCRVLLFLIDITGEVPPDGAYRQLDRELGLYSEGLIDKPRFIALNKIDLLQEDRRDVEFPGSGGEQIFYISALQRKGLGELVQTLFEAVRRETEKENEP